MVIVIITVTLTGQTHNQTKLTKALGGDNTTPTSIRKRGEPRGSDKSDMPLINSDIVRECKRLQTLPAHSHTFEHGIASEALRHTSL